MTDDDNDNNNNNNNNNRGTGTIPPRPRAQRPEARQPPQFSFGSFFDSFFGTGQPTNAANYSSSGYVTKTQCVYAPCIYVQHNKSKNDLSYYL